MAVTLTVKTDAFKRLISRKTDAFLQAATLELHRIAQKKASIQNEPRTVKITRPRAGGNKTSRTIYPHPSKPGESPRMRTGIGHKNIVQGYRRGLKQGRVGYTRNVRYMLFHELGIHYRVAGSQKRPTIIPALKDNEAWLNAAGRRAAEAQR